MRALLRKERLETSRSTLTDEEEDRTVSACATVKGDPPKQVVRRHLRERIVPVVPEASTA